MMRWSKLRSTKKTLKWLLRSLIHYNKDSKQSWRKSQRKTEPLKPTGYWISGELLSPYWAGPLRLPKDHKEGPLKGRPIISTLNSVVRPLAQHIVDILTPLVNWHVAAHLRSISHFIQEQSFSSLDGWLLWIFRCCQSLWLYSSDRNIQGLISVVTAFFMITKMKQSFPSCVIVTSAIFSSLCSMKMCTFSTNASTHREQEFWWANARLHLWWLFTWIMWKVVTSICVKKSFSGKDSLITFFSLPATSALTASLQQRTLWIASSSSPLKSRTITRYPTSMFSWPKKIASLHINSTQNPCIVDVVYLLMHSSLIQRKSAWSPSK